MSEQEEIPSCLYIGVPPSGRNDGERVTLP
jgi:hypothetical protein